MSLLNDAQQQLWDRILNFELDDPDSSFPFSHRLMRENDWSMQYALRVILEYKRFMFLICVSDHPMTPSDEVDQVWHLHLLYTESYWVDFCKETLERDIHHGPTRGSEERGQFKSLYHQTLERYEELFGEMPPQDIWPATDQRFSTTRFTRINRDENWVIPKIKFRSQ